MKFGIPISAEAVTRPCGDGPKHEFQLLLTGRPRQRVRTGAHMAGVRVCADPAWIKSTIIDAAARTRLCWDEPRACKAFVVSFLRQPSSRTSVRREKRARLGHSKKRARQVGRGPRIAFSPSAVLHADEHHPVGVESKLCHSSREQTVVLRESAAGVSSFGRRQDQCGPALALRSPRSLADKRPLRRKMYDLLSSRACPSATEP
jgi:hypothetical protein